MIERAKADSYICRFQTTILIAMSQKNVKAIHVEEDVWLTLIRLKYELRYRNMSDVIRHLLEKCGYMNTQAPSDGV